MKKFINIRPMVVAAISLVLVVVAYYLSITMGVAVVVITYLAIIAILAVLLIKHYSLFNLILVLILLLMIAIMSVRCYNIVKNYNLYKDLVMYNVKVVGTVKDISYNNSIGRYFVTLKDVKINDVAYNFNISGIVVDNFVGGQTLTFKCNLISVPYDTLKYSVADNVVFRFSSAKNISIISDNINVFDRLALSIKSLIKDNIPQEYDFAVALMLGDTDNISQATLSNFRYSGIAHIFAVSGLHIGFLCSVVGFLCEGLYIKHFKKCIVVTLIAIIYSGICGFSESSLRAVVICFWILLCKSFGNVYDDLNTIALACITIIFLSPMSVLTEGFILSFACVLSVSLFKFTFLDMLEKTKLPLKETLSTALSILFGVTPIMCYLFGYISVCSLILNLLFIPIVSALYTMLAVSIVFAYVRLTAPLKIVGAMISVIKDLFAMTDFSKFIVLVEITPILLVVYYSLAFFASDIVNVKKNTKFKIVAILFISMIVLAL